MTSKLTCSIVQHALYNSIPSLPPDALNQTVFRLAFCGCAACMKHRHVNRMKQQAAHVSVIFPEELSFLQGVNDWGVAVCKEHADAYLLKFTDQPLKCARACWVYEGYRRAVQDYRVEGQFSLYESESYNNHLRGHLFCLLLCLSPLSQLQERLNSNGFVEGFEERVLVCVVQRRLEAEHLNPRRRHKVLVLVQVLVKITAAGPAQQRDLASNDQITLD